MKTPDSLLLLSGGLDSVTLFHRETDRVGSVKALMVNYGQIHFKELRFARWHVEKLKAPSITVEMTLFNGFLHSALTTGKGSVIVPNRNAMLLSVAAGIAASEKIPYVLIACNKTDQAVFPDTRPGFIEIFNAMLHQAGVAVTVRAPYSTLTKTQIVSLAKLSRVPIQHTWSCYKGGPRPCGRCLACRERTKAIREDAKL